MKSPKESNMTNEVSILRQAWDLGRQRKFTHLTFAGFTGGMAFVYFMEFIYTFSGKAVDPEMAHAVLLIKIILIGLLVLRALLYAVEQLSPADEMDQVIKQSSLQITWAFLSIAIIASLLSWSLHERTETVFHLIFVSWLISLTVFHFASSIKYMNFMAKPALFELDGPE